MVVECCPCACVLYPLEFGLMQNWHILPVWQRLWCLDVFFQQNNFHNWTLLLWFPKHKFKKLEIIIIIIMIKKENLRLCKRNHENMTAVSLPLNIFLHYTIHTGSLFDQCMSLKNSFTCKDGLVRRWVSLLGMMTFNVPDKLWY